MRISDWSSDVCSSDLPLRRLVDEVHASLLDDPTSASDPTAGGAMVRAAHPLLSEADVAAVSSAVAARASGLGPLEPLLADPSVTEVMLNGRGDVWAERGGRLERLALDLDEREVEVLVERVVAPLGLRVDRTSPIADARLPDGSRVNVVVPPLAIDGPCVTIRRFGARRTALAELCPPGVSDLPGWAVQARCNIIVSGGTGAGKTTVTNALCTPHPGSERIVTVEDPSALPRPAHHPT